MTVTDFRYITSLSIIILQGVRDSGLRNILTQRLVTKARTVSIE